MLSRTEFIRQSLEVNLFFARIMKEHSFFLEAGFVDRDSNFKQQADNFRMEFDKLLADTVALSNGVISPEVAESGEIVTQYTLKAEQLTKFYTGVNIPTGITQAETGLSGGTYPINVPMLEGRVFMLNERALCLVTALIQFKTQILSDVLTCKMFTNNYPLLIDHILREAKLYAKMIQRIQRREDIDIVKEAAEQELFWNRIMAEHAKFIRGLLDPTEEELINAANNFANEFDELTNESKAAMDKVAVLSNVTAKSLKATKDIRDFKAQGTQGLIECKIKSIIIPLLGDHTLREANHFLRLLKSFKKES